MNVGEVGGNMKFVFDLDGTICFKGKPLSVGIINALEACRQSGHA